MWSFFIGISRLRAHLSLPAPRLSGDMVHLLSFIVLVLKINATKSCRGSCVHHVEVMMILPCMHDDRLADVHMRPSRHSDRLVYVVYVRLCVPPGISLKTQELYTLVFVCRYLDLFTNFISMCAATPAMHVTLMLCSVRQSD